MRGAVAFYALTFGLSNEDRDIFIKISRVFKFRRAAARENFSPAVVPHTKAAGSPTSGTQECKMCIGGSSKQLVSISKNATKLIVSDVIFTLNMLLNRLFFYFYSPQKRLKVKIS